MKHLLPILLVVVFASSAGCHREAAVTADGRTPVRAYLMLLNTKQVEYFSWAEATFEAAHPDIDIIIEQFPGSSLKDYEIKIRLRYASKQSPDIWVFRENALSEFVNLGLLAPAPPYIERIVQENSLNELVRQAPYFNGTCYGIVQVAAWQALYYNKKMFREAGLDPERPPETWDEMLDYADRLTIRRPDGSIERAGLSLRKTGYKPGISEKWLTFFYSAGGTPFNEDGTESYFNSEAGHAATALYKEAMDRNIDAIEVEGDQQGFGQERVAMFIRELHVVDWMKVNYPDVEFGVAQLPKKDSTFSSGGAYPMVVSSESPHQEEAWRFLEFLMSDDVYARYAEIMHEMPTLKSVAERPQFKNDPYLQVFINQPAYIPPKFAHDKRSLEILGAYLERFAYGHLSIEETLNRATEDINAHLQTNYARYHRDDRPMTHPASLSPPPGTQLTKHGLVLRRGPVDAWDGGMVESPVVWFDKPRQRYGMVYTGYAWADPPTPGYAAMAKPQIGLAWSDDLLHWEKDPRSPIFGPTGIAGTPDSHGTPGPFIWHENSLYYLFYFGTTATGYEKGTKTLNLAISPDLVTWTRYTGNPIITPHGSGWRTEAIWHPNIVKVDKTYYLFFNTSGVVNGNHEEFIGYATSTDLFTWTVDDENAPILMGSGTPGAWDATGRAGDPSVFKVGHTWYMAYYSWDGTNTQDGLAWTTEVDFPLGWQPYEGNPILPLGEPGTFDALHAGKPFVFRTPERHFHFYTAVDDDETREIAVAVEPAL